MTGKSPPPGPTQPIEDIRAIRRKWKISARSAQRAIDDIRTLRQPTSQSDEQLSPSPHTLPLLVAAYCALRSYQYGNDSQELAENIANDIGIYLQKVGKLPFGEPTV